MKGSLIYVDANVFLHAADLYGNSPQAPACKALLTAVGQFQLDAATSCLTWDELTWSGKKALGLEAASDFSREFLELPNVRLLPANPQAINRAQSLVERIGLYPRDAIHAATALLSGSEAIVTEYPDFAKLGKEIAVMNASQALKSFRRQGTTR